MSISTGLYAYLTGYAGLTALIVKRLYPLVLPQGVTLPAVRYQRISTSRLRSHSGPSGLAYPTFQFSVHAGTAASADAVAAQLTAALECYQGPMGAGALGATVQAAFVVGDVDDYDAETGQYMRHVDAIIWHEE